MTRELRRIAILLMVLMMSLGLTPFSPVVAEETGGSLLDDLGLPVLEITITDDRVEAPETFEAGLVLLQVNNAASTPASFGIVDPPEGITGDEVAANFAEPVLAEWWFDTIVPVAHDTLPGQTLKVALLLDAGVYEVVASSGGPGEDTIPVPLGSATLTVAGALAGDAGEAIAAAATFDFGPYAFSIEGAVPVGPAIIKITNTHTVPHHAVIFTTDRLYDHDEAHAGIMSLFQGTPVADGGFNLSDEPPVQVLPALGGGATAWVEVNFEPGFYAAVCFIADPGQEVPHVMMGMIQVFEVAG